FSGSILDRTSYLSSTPSPSFWDDVRYATLAIYMVVYWNKVFIPLDFSWQETTTTQICIFTGHDEPCLLLTGRKSCRSSRIDTDRTKSNGIGSELIVEDTCNMENSGEKRILEEYDKIERNPSDDFKFRKLDWNHMNGKGGIYHVRLLFPKEYPWKEPSFIFLTENGSFNINTKVTLNWKPSMRVRDALLELIALMPTCPDGNLDSVKDKEERRDLAKKSRAAAPKFGSYERQKLIDVNHDYMQRDVPQLQLTRNTSLTQRCEAYHIHILHLERRRVAEVLLRRERVGIMSWIADEEVVVDRVGSTQMESDRSVIVEDKCNIKNSLEKRILEEYNEIKSNPSYDFTCLTQGWNKYEWQFAIRGPSGTEFEGGIYHGMVQFSEGYPSKPPSIVFLTKNGCFEIKTSISLRLLSNWQPSWSVRKTILAFIEEMANYPNGELVSVENNREKRRDLAIKSCAAAPTYGTSARQEVIDGIHEYMLSKATLVPVSQLSPVSNGTGGGSVVNNIVGNTFNVHGSKQSFFEAVGRTINPVNGATRLLEWEVGGGQAVVECYSTACWSHFLSTSLVTTTTIAFMIIMFDYNNISL
ncbi:ubiquitin-conjugating enzyme 32, partial [Prunus dulcis]